MTTFGLYCEQGSGKSMELKIYILLKNQNCFGGTPLKAVAATIRRAGLSESYVRDIEDI